MGTSKEVLRCGVSFFERSGRCHFATGRHFHLKILKAHGANFKSGIESSHYCSPLLKCIDPCPFKHEAVRLDKSSSLGWGWGRGALGGRRQIGGPF